MNIYKEIWNTYPGTNSLLRRYAHLIMGVGLSLYMLSSYVRVSELPMIVISGGVGSIFPDLDVRYKHRKALHNIFSLIISSIIVLILAEMINASMFITAGYSIGYVSHLAGDMLTRRGIAILYPFRTRFYRIPTPLGKSEDFLVNFVGAAIGLLLIFLSLRRI